MTDYSASLRGNGVLSEAGPSTFMHPTLLFLRNYWESKRGVRTMPARADISPSELREHLGWIVMLDVLPCAREFRYKLIGTLVTRYFTSDWTGRTVSEAFSNRPEIASALNATFRKVVRDKIVVRVSGDSDWLAKGTEKFEAAYLPLSDDGQNVNVILHAFVFNRPEVLLAREIARQNGTQEQLISSSDSQASPAA